jgi:hypothetical protein
MNDENQLSSIDRLLEFGMSMAVAQQMMQMMNTAMQSMNTPRAQPLNIPAYAASQFYALVENVPQGPFSEGQVAGFIASGNITPETLVWIHGLPGWMQARQVPEVARLFGGMPPPPL